MVLPIAEAQLKLINMPNLQELWFEDGNIVIIAEKTEFRVYRGILAQKSDLFKDLFTLPQPEGGETLYGCSVVRVQDLATDWYRFLSVLFGGASMWTNNQQYSWRLTRSIITISNKYQVDVMRDEAMERLQKRFPANIDDWDKLYGAEILGSMSDVISMANAARLLELPGVRARALYECTQLSTDQLLVGIENEDGVREVLCTEDIKFCVDARKTLAQEHIKLRVYLTELEDAPVHINNTKCIAARRKLVHISQQRSKYIDHDPLAPDDDVKNILAEMCRSCRKYHRNEYQRLRQKLLHKLPLYFGLGGEEASEESSSDESD
ncbi:hypothetical protein EUX98_g4293 [Antrodiella citrinella]|uniref:BTB domain-containing protein n=1 Tax=Antrodiella citrinella TaxID=2447956 RepID=A0A4S4N2B5_9APHY|nr:hypothetical protein EUX98_g4293 [Antrodiella citrinella]